MYEPQNFDRLLGTAGFSDDMLKNHFTLYQGYVKNFNTLDSTLMAMEKEGNLIGPEYAELNRRLGWEFNGMRLHELYFGNMTRSVIPSTSSGQALSESPEATSRRISPNFHQTILKEWGSWELWQKDFCSMGAMRGIGWVILYQDKAAKRLFNVWINEHDMGHFAGCTPLLVMDVFEHAYMLDYGLKRADYIEAFWKAIDWSVVGARV